MCYFFSAPFCILSVRCFLKKLRMIYNYFFLFHSLCENAFCMRCVRKLPTYTFPFFIRKIVLYLFSVWLATNTNEKRQHYSKLWLPALLAPIRFKGNENKITFYFQFVQCFIFLFNFFCDFRSSFRFLDSCVRIAFSTSFFTLS